jgi:Tfp pilus assembly protein PilF
MALSSLFFFLLGSVPCWSQTRTPTVDLARRTFSIQGSIRNYDSNHPMEMLKVDLKKLTGVVVATTFTRSNGEFEFGGLTPGQYLIVVEERGYEPIRENIEIINTSRPGVYLFLKRPLEITRSEPGSAVSARELSLPRKARDAMQKGTERLYQKKDYRGSLAEFQRVIREAPSYYEAYEQMGVAYMNLGQTSEAEEAFRKSLELSENKYPGAYFWLASLLCDNQKFAEAEPLARRGLELDANAWRGHFELARTLLGLKRLEAAEKSAQEARTRNSAFPPLYLVLANIHINRRDYPALVEDLDTYLKLDPSGPMSEQARQTRDKVKGLLASTQNAPAAQPPKP